METITFDGMEVRVRQWVVITAHPADGDDGIRTFPTKAEAMALVQELGEDKVYAIPVL